MADNPQCTSLSKKGVPLAYLLVEVEALLVDPELEGNEEALRYLRSIARRAGDLLRTVSACCYTISYPKVRR